MSHDVTGRDRLRPLRRMRSLENQVETLAAVVTDTAVVVRALLRQVAELERDRDDLAAKLGGQVDELEQRVEQLTTDVPHEPGAFEPGYAAVVRRAAEDAAEPDPEPAAPVLTEKQQELVAAVNDLRSASTGDIARYVGRDGEGDAVGMALQKLKRMGVVAHNGRRAKGARWLAVTTAPAAAPEPAKPAAVCPRAPKPPAAEDPAVELTDLDERIIRLVEQHGPCTHVYVADNLVKNRRETGARMRELARNGLLVDLDGAFATPDLADAA